MANDMPSLDSMNAGVDKLNKGLTGILGTLNKIGTIVDPINQKVSGVTSGGCEHRALQGQHLCDVRRVCQPHWQHHRALHWFCHPQLCRLLSFD